MLTETQVSVNQPNELLAGGTHPTRFDCKEAWYPVHYVEDLDKTKPNKFTLLVEILTDLKAR